MKFGEKEVLPGRVERLRKTKQSKFSGSVSTNHSPPAFLRRFSAFTIAFLSQLSFLPCSPHACCSLSLEDIGRVCRRSQCALSVLVHLLCLSVMRQ